MLRAVLDLLAPVRCLACRRRGGQPWCRECAPAPLEATATCPRCGAAVDQSMPTDGGPACPLRDAPVEAVVAAHDYRGVAGRVVRTAKLEGCTAAYPGLAHDLARAVRARGWPLPDLVTGVPVPARRRRRRGFDHAGRLAAGVAASLGRPYADLLTAQPTAVDRGRAGRESNRVAAMAARDRVPGDVLLVDDVVTTGATVRAAASALRAGGATTVRVATVTRAGGHVRQETAE